MLSQNNLNILKQWKIEARRDYLLEHARRIHESLKFYIKESLEKFVFQRANIKQWEDFFATEINNSILEEFLNNIKNQLKSYPDNFIQNLIKSLDIILLPNIGDDGVGISQNLGKQFAQLALQNRAAFVELHEAGLIFYWDHEKSQNHFAGLLKIFGIDIIVSIKEAPKHENYTHAIYAVTVSHLHLEKLLELSQYHPYSLTEAANDLYQAKNLNRAACLIDAAIHQSYFDPLKTARVNKTTRISLDENNDILTIGITALLPNKKNQRQAQHVVILLDDSGSMTGKKMKTANNALREFIYQLPDDTLISLQPFNADTQLVRISVAEIKKMSKEKQYAIFNIPATRDTPLVEILAGSAAFLRKDEKSYIITKAELNNTTIVLLTDGQASATAIHTLQVMQSSTSYNPRSNVKLKNANVSYGIPGFTFKEKPVVITAGIGNDSDRKYIESLSEALSCPHVYLDDNEANFNEQFNGFFNLIKSVQGRLPNLFVGLRYYNTRTQKNEIIGSEARNLFVGYTRDIQFVIPKTAINVQACLISNDSYDFYNIDYQITQCPDLLTSYLQTEFLKIKQTYSDSIIPLRQQLADGKKPIVFAENSRFSSRVNIPIVPGQKEAEKWTIKLIKNNSLNAKDFEDLDKCILIVGQQYYKKNFYFVEKGELIKNNNQILSDSISVWPVEYEEIPNEIFQSSHYEENRKKIINYLLCHLESLKNGQDLLIEIKKKIEELNTVIKNKLNSYIILCHNTLLVNEIQSFVKAIDSSQYTLPLISRDRRVVAEEAQNRFLGRPAAAAELQIREEQIFIYIQNGDYNTAFNLIKADPRLLTLRQQTVDYRATPLIFALVLLQKLPKKEVKSKDLRFFILDILDLYNLNNISQFQLQLSASDASGNTALHRAIWYGEFQIAKKILLLAAQNGELENLNKICNKTVVGNKTGETCFDLIKTVDVLILSSAEKQDLLLLLQPNQPKSKNLLNYVTQGLSTFSFRREDDDKNPQTDRSLLTPVKK